MNERRDLSGVEDGVADYRLPAPDLLISRLSLIREEIGRLNGVAVEAVAGMGEVKVGNFIPAYGQTQAVIDLSVPEHPAVDFERARSAYLNHDQQALDEALRTRRDGQELVGLLSAPHGYKIEPLPFRNSLMNFQFGELKITLEDKPTYLVTDSAGKEAAFVRHLAKSEQDLNRSAHIFSISFRGEPSLRLSVGPTGEVTFLSPYLENTYRDALTGALTNEDESFEGRGKTVKNYNVFADLPLSRRERVMNFFMPKYTGGVKRAKVGRKYIPIEDIRKHQNQLVGSPDTINMPAAEQPTPEQMAAVLTELVKKGLAALEEEANKVRAAKRFSMISAGARPSETKLSN